MDIDGDGRLDLVTGSDNCCNTKREVFVFRRGPEGRFHRRKAIPTREADGRGWFPVRTMASVADWDGDGRPDVVITGSTGGGLSVGPSADRAEVELTGRIAGSEALRWSWTEPEVVDWDGDGRPDVVGGENEGREGNGVYLLRRVGNAKESRVAAPVRLVFAPDGATVTGLDVADWDGDGVTDLIVGLTWPGSVVDGRPTYRSQVWVYRRIPHE